MLDLLQTREYFHILVNVDIDDTHLYAVEVASECRLYRSPFDSGKFLFQLSVSV